MLFRSLLLSMVWGDASSGLEMFYCICHYLPLSIIGFDFEKLVFEHLNYESLHECMFKTNSFYQGLMMIHAQICGRGADSSAQPHPRKIKTFYTQNKSTKSRLWTPCGTSPTWKTFESMHVIAWSIWRYYQGSGSENK